MKTVRYLTAAVCAAGTMMFGHASAQDQAKPPSFVPVEIFTCNYNDGKSRKDLDRVKDRWIKWMDANHPTPYNAWIMSPQYAPADLGFDVAWIGAWPNGNAMGEGSNAWMTKGRAMSAEFDAVVQCSHANFASLNVKAPMGGAAPEQSLVNFSDCKIADGKTMDDASGAIREWTAYLSAQGSESVMWMFFPAYGAGKVDFDFKMVTAHPGYASLGKDYELYGNGGGYKKATELFGGVLDCDSARVYDATRVRSGFSATP